MPVYLDIDQLARVVMIVAHGEVTNDDIRKTVQELLAADVPAFAKIIDTSAAATRETLDQVAEIARLLREGAGNQPRGPVACVVDARRPGFAEALAEQSAADRPIRLFTSLREARRWIDETKQDRR
ncbi:MAG: hypothetical protein J0J01_14290 [Reyranella sp.]|uniref:hypothetical protein n=1 Tax=Reyranella sp. TaxID=1929291 RepID=UPI001AD3172C|nr:hypothetical protein [Reyranella sp.]MBN9088075.1 hypothetical protein [Reyranella sp.]